MSGTKFTPGPWTATGDKIHQASLDASVIAGRIAHVDRGCHRQDMANAHLIAAAPDLFAALDAICGDLANFTGAPSDYADWINPRFRAGRAALAKARGEA